MCSVTHRGVKHIEVATPHPLPLSVWAAAVWPTVQGHCRPEHIQTSDAGFARRMTQTGNTHVLFLFFLLLGIVCNVFAACLFFHSYMLFTLCSNVFFFVVFIQNIKMSLCKHGLSKDTIRGYLSCLVMNLKMRSPRNLSRSAHWLGPWCKPEETAQHKGKITCLRSIKASSVTSAGQASKDNGRTVCEGHAVQISSQSCDFHDHMMSASH